MGRFGTSVADYLGKTSPYKSVPQTSDVNQKVGTDPTQTSAQNPSVDSTQNPTGYNNGNSSKMAVSGGMSPAASGLVNPIPQTIFQPTLTQPLGDRSDSIWGRENSINNTTDVLNSVMSNRVGQYNQSQQQSQTGAPGQQFAGNDPGNSGLTQEQYGNAQTIANVGRQRGMSDQDIQTAIMTGLTESGLKNLNYGDRDSLGLFQQRPSQGWGTPQQVTDPTYASNKFYDSLSKVSNRAGIAPWQAAQQVQRSFDPTGFNYQRQYGLAQRAFQALQSGSFNKLTSTNGQINSAQSFINQYNNKYVDYDGKFGAQCVDLYDYYTAGFVGGKVGLVGYAPEIYTNYDSKAYNRYGSNQTPGRMGDVAVFRPGGGTPSGHVAIVVGDNGNGTLRVLQANATSMGSAGPTIISNISKSTLMGYLRPVKLGG
jgi:hypothetical protein